eukprot:m.40331 g.40331  ORF g.40331 m.40331 type:complete len:743 (+) comp6920_c0_seq1:67-2295(+)
MMEGHHKQQQHHLSAQNAEGQRGLDSVLKDVDEVKNLIFEKINKHFEDYITSFDISGTYDSELQSLKQTVQLMKDNIQSNNVDAVLDDFEENETSNSTVQITDAIIDMLEKMSEVDKDLLAYDTCIDSGRFLDAASKLKQVGHAMSVLKTHSKFADAKILSILQADHDEKRAHLKSHMEDIWRRAVVFQQPAVGTQHVASVQVTSPLELSESNNVEVDVRDVVNTLSELGVWSSHSKHFTDTLVTNIILPLCENHSLELIVSSSRNVTTLTLEDKTTKVKTRKPRSKLKMVQEALGVFQSLGKIVEFVVNTILQGDNVHVQTFGKLLFPQFFDAVVEHLLSKAVSLQASNADLHKKVVEATAALQRQLVRFSIIPAGDTQLTDYVARVKLHSTNRERQECIVHARQILLSDNLNTICVEHKTEKGGLFPAMEQFTDGDTAELRESIYSLPSYHITETTKKFVNLLYSTLDAATSTESENTVQLFFAVRDMLELYLAVVPTVHKKALESAPPVSVTLHNDCFYVAHHLLSLGYQYKTALPEKVQPIATFVDMVPVFRKLGTDHLLKMMKRQHEALSQCLDECGGFGDTVDPKRYETVERGLKQVLHTFEGFVKTCKSIMQPEMFKRVAGSLVSHVCGRIVAEVLTLNDLDTKETTHISNFVQLLTAKFTALGMGALSDAEREKVVPEWLRFIQLGEIMTNNMMGIKEKFDQNHWDFTAAEMRGFVKAIFSDSPKRRGVLSELR